MGRRSIRQGGLLIAPAAQYGVAPKNDKLGGNHFLVGDVVAVHGERRQDDSGCKAKIIR